MDWITTCWLLSFIFWIVLFVITMAFTFLKQDSLALAFNTAQVGIIIPMWTFIFLGAGVGR